MIENIKSHLDMRSYLVDHLRKDMMGPISSDEVIDEPPTKRYIIGILYPKQTEIDPEEDQDANLIPEVDEETIDPIVLTKTFLPASMGLSFTAKVESFKVKIHVTTAMYIKIETKKEKETKEEQLEKTGWKRIPLEKIVEISINGNMNKTETLFPTAPYLDLNIIVREHTGFYHIVVTLMNNYEFQGRRYEIDEHCFFQSKLRLEFSSSNGKFISHRKFQGENPNDALFYELLYRNKAEFAVGHGVSVFWNDPIEPSFIETEYIPSYEVPAIRIKGMIKSNLSIKFLAHGETEEIFKELNKIPTSYEKWINKRQSQLTSLNGELRKIAEYNIRECQNTLERIRNGIDELHRNKIALQCFRLSNEATLIQISRSQWRKKPLDEREKEPRLSDDITWRPFQIAFFLLNIVSICYPQSNERKIVDLLWFPTGGGKTEAYLALIAFTIFYRRITNKDSSLSPYGTTAIMRYTLRLLTIQQFERASSLICACEYLRSKNKILGNKPISVGLWVGQSSTPNDLNKTEEILEEIKESEFYQGTDPRQISSCPWCGYPFSINNYAIEEFPRRLVIRCHNIECLFSNEDGLPIYVVDEDIYRVCPTLLIGTVDKFARLPWKGEVGLLFGRDGNNRLRTLPPELIIQDELHLISGPLGSLVGLYETIIEFLCHSHEGNPPKIISSTATIKQAKEQVKYVFNRPLKQFPPPCIIASDSFFSQLASPEEIPGRIYLGLNAPGTSGKTLLLRVYADLLIGIQKPDCKPTYRDPYWTLVGYFNSLRELGAARTLVDDDIQARYKLLRNRYVNEKIRIIIKKNKEIKVEEARKSILKEQIPFREIYAKELTGRVPSTEIPKTLKELELSFNPDDQDLAIPVLLATNMISVGVDVNRLGLMVVTGQPKGTSEYIQSTSRVGRKFPGLIISLYNWNRPRDLSHYEHFQSYHSALYRFIETTSVTPFSSRAMDRGIHAVFISLIRHNIPQMSSETAAQNFSRLNNSDLSLIRDYILNRIHEVDGRKSSEEAREILKQTEFIWRGHSSTSQDLTYRIKFDPKRAREPHLLHPAEDINPTCGTCYPTLNSLRNVEPQLGLYRLRKKRGV